MNLPPREPPDRHAPDPGADDRASAIAGVEWLWVSCPTCNGDVAFMATSPDGQAGSYDVDTAPPELVLDLCGATTICPLCETVVTFLVKLHANVAARALPGGRRMFDSDTAFLTAYGWTDAPSDGRWQHLHSPFGLATEAAVWQQQRWLLAALRPSQLLANAPEEAAHLYQSDQPPPPRRPRRSRRGRNH